MSEKKYTPRQIWEKYPHKATEIAEDCPPLSSVEEKTSRIEAGREHGEMLREGRERARKIIEKKRKEASLLQSMREYFTAYDFNAWDEEMRTPDMREEAVAAYLAAQGFDADSAATAKPHIENFLAKSARVAEVVQEAWDEWRKKTKQGGYYANGYDMDNFDSHLHNTFFGFYDDRAEIEILPTAISFTMRDPDSYNSVLGKIRNVYGSNLHQRILGMQYRNKNPDVDVLLQYRQPDSTLHDFREFGSTRVHEEAHALNDAIFQLVGFSDKEKMQAEELSMAVAVKNERIKEIKSRLASYVDDFDRFTSRRLLDELLARARTDDHKEETVRILTTPASKGGPYDFYNTEKEYLLFNLDQNHTLRPAERTEVIDGINEGLNERRERALKTLNQLMAIWSKLKHYSRVDSDELYLWLVTEAQKCETINQVKTRWERLENAARTSYMMKFGKRGAVQES